MPEFLDIGIVAVALLGAAAYLYRRFTRKSDSGCAVGCGSCGPSDAPPKNELVQLRRKP